MLFFGRDRAFFFFWGGFGATSKLVHGEKWNGRKYQFTFRGQFGNGGLQSYRLELPARPTDLVTAFERKKKIAVEDGLAQSDTLSHLGQ